MFKSLILSAIHLLQKVQLIWCLLTDNAIPSTICKQNIITARTQMVSLSLWSCVCVCVCVKKRDWDWDLMHRKQRVPVFLSQALLSPSLSFSLSHKHTYLQLFPLNHILSAPSKRLALWMKVHFCCSFELAIHQRILKHKILIRCFNFL